jgi:hypothetical protein
MICVKTKTAYQTLTYPEFEPVLCVNRTKNNTGIVFNDEYVAEFDKKSFIVRGKDIVFSDRIIFDWSEFVGLHLLDDVVTVAVVSHKTCRLRSFNILTQELMSEVCLSKHKPDRVVFSEDGSVAALIRGAEVDYVNTSAGSRIMSHDYSERAQYSSHPVYSQMELRVSAMISPVNNRAVVMRSDGRLFSTDLDTGTTVIGGLYSTLDSFSMDGELVTCSASILPRSVHNQHLNTIVLNSIDLTLVYTVEHGHSILDSRNNTVVCLDKTVKIHKRGTGRLLQDALFPDKIVQIALRSRTVVLI